ncbi:MAG: hypothetical protein AB8B51_09760 [Sedimentitalea sp.]
MPILIAILGLATAIVFFVLRARNAAHAASDLADMANDVRLAARRFGFRRRGDLHPAESIEDPKLAIATLAMAYQELDGAPTQDQRDQLSLSLRKHLTLDQGGASEAMVLGRWMVAQCGGPDAAVSRISRKLFRLGGAEQLAPLISVIQGSMGDQDQPSQRQHEALQDIQRAFKV